MRARPSNLVALCLGALFALGCASDPGGDLEGERVPMCTDELGCPEGTRCVNGQTCVPIDGAALPVPPALPGAPPSPPTASPGVPGNGSGQQGDGGIERLDGGDDVDGGPFVDCDPGEVACDGLCVDTFSDRRHCGGCGIDCGLGGECVSGICLPDEGSVLPPGNPPFGL